MRKMAYPCIISESMIGVAAMVVVHGFRRSDDWIDALGLHAQLVEI